MAVSTRLSFTPGTELVEGPSDNFTLVGPDRQLAVSRPSNALLAALRQLLAGGATERELATLVLDSEGYTALPELYRLLLASVDHLLLGHCLFFDGRPVVTAVPLGHDYPLSLQSVMPDTRYVLSRFAHLRRQDQTWVLESPLSHAQILLHDKAVATFIAELAVPWHAAEGDRPMEAASAVLDLLWSLKLLSRVDEGGVSAEDRDPSLMQWEFHDLLFHSRSRKGRHRNPYGRTFPFQGRTKPPPAFKSGTSSETTALFRPDIPRLEDTDLPFTRVLEERRSLRKQGSPPISLRELGELLYRSARARKLSSHEDDETTERVYPGGGAAYELEIYLVVNHCLGLARGLYHYRPGEHELCLVSAPTPELEALLQSAARTAMTDLPQVLLVLGARFQRLSWRYTSMAYATVLKDVGVLYQTLYLVATAMGLAACALGGGDSDLFAKAAGTCYTEETSVGELILGSRGQ